MYLKFAGQRVKFVASSSAISIAGQVPERLSRLASLGQEEMKLRCKEAGVLKREDRGERREARRSKEGMERKEKEHRFSQ